MAHGRQCPACGKAIDRPQIFRPLSHAKFRCPKCLTELKYKGIWGARTILVCLMPLELIFVFAIFFAVISTGTESLLMFIIGSVFAAPFHFASIFLIAWLYHYYLFHFKRIVVKHPMKQDIDADWWR